MQSWCLVSTSLKEPDNQTEFPFNVPLLVSVTLLLSVWEGLLYCSDLSMINNEWRIHRVDTIITQQGGAEAMLTFFLCRSKKYASFLLRQLQCQSCHGHVFVSFFLLFARTRCPHSLPYLQNRNPSMSKTSETVAQRSGKVSRIC